MWKFVVAYILFIVFMINMVITAATVENKAADSYVRDRVVWLTGNEMSCSGVQVKAPSGKVYTLTAAHCKSLAGKQRIVAETEDGHRFSLDIVKIDVQHDLMTLTSSNQKSVDVAEKIEKHLKVHTITHGERYPSYRTDGELLIEEIFNVLGEPIWTDEDFSHCPVTKYSMPVLTERGMYCGMTLNLMVTTAWVRPGSSGGPAFDEKGGLIGIVSCSHGDMFSGLVPLSDIKKFLRDL